MKRLFLLILILAAAALCFVPALCFSAPSIGQWGIPKWTSNGLEYQWVTPQNDKVFKINSSGMLEMATNGGSASLQGLSDVAITDLQDSQSLRWDPTANNDEGAWVNTGALHVIAGESVIFHHSDGSDDVTSYLSAADGQAAMSWTLPSEPGRLLTINSALDPANFVNGSIAITKLASSSITIGTGNVVSLGGSTTASAILSTLSSGTTRGAIAYRGASGWVVLTPGSNGQVLTSGGAGADPSFTTISSGGLTIGTTAITSGVSGRVLYDNGGVVGEFTGLTLTSGRIGSAVFNAASGFTGSLLDLQVDGSSKCEMTHDGRLRLSGDVYNNFASPILQIAPGRGLCTTGAAILNIAAGSTDVANFTGDGQFAVGSAGKIGFTAGNPPGAAYAETFWDRPASSTMRLLGAIDSSIGGVLRMKEISSPASAPPADHADIWIEDSGGKTRFMIRFPTGPAIQLSIEP
ncbi:MAG: hypothetical protein V4662_12115 [Verrucomicrobiota bacterium]